MNRYTPWALLCCFIFGTFNVRAGSSASPASLGFVGGGVHPRFGQTWVAPDGVAWYGVVRDDDGHAKQLSFSKAAKLCKKAGLRLPEREDYELLAEMLGGADYAAPDFLELAGHIFATASIEAVRVAGRGFPVSQVFVGDTGTIAHRPAPKLDHERYAARCVAGRALSAW